MYAIFAFIRTVALGAVLLLISTLATPAPLAPHTRKPVRRSLLSGAIVTMACLGLLADDAMAQQMCTPPPSDLLSWYPAEGNANDIRDGNNGTLVNGAAFDSGMVGQAFRFTASLNSGVRVPSSANLNPVDAITLDAWVFPFSFPNSSPSILRKDTDTVGSTQYLIAVGSGSVPGVAHCNIGRFADPAGGSVPLNQWTHVACTYDRQFARLYVNGVEVAAQAATQPIPTSARELWIGNEEPLPTNGMIRQFDGLIDEVEIFSRALSASEIQAMFDAGSAGKCRTCTPPPPDMVSWWPADGDASDIQEGNDGTLANGATIDSGLVDQAFRFTTSNSGIQIPAHASLNPANAITLDAWVFPFSFPNGAPSILRRETGAGVQYLIAVGNGNTAGVAHCNIGNFAAPVGGVVPLNQWSHIACAYDREFARLYVNGVHVAASPGTQPIPASSRELWIGNLEGGTIRRFNGLIDEIEIFNRALTASEIQAIVKADSAGKCKDPDSDSDGIPDSEDNCPLDPNPEQTDTDGDGLGDACDNDIDGDGVANGNDNCSLNANPDQIDTDADGIGNVCDEDEDNDGVPHSEDNCPLHANPDQIDTDGDGQGDACDGDADGDGVLNANDNCPLDANPDQVDLDGDGIGDACENDTDGDGVDNGADNCPLVANPDQLDTDGDGNGNACDVDDDNDSVPDGGDNCPLVPNTNQTDLDTDGIGDVCDADVDGDGVNDGADNCPLAANFDQADADGDGQGDVCDGDDDNDSVADGNDNCPFTANPNQADSDGDGEGNVCDGDADGDGVLNANDNCPSDPNTDQADLDADLQGDACDDDVDGDGFVNEDDSCPASDLRPTVVVGSCDSGVANSSAGSGCMIADLVESCAAGALNHGDFVNCAAHLLNDLKNKGIVTGPQKAAIQSCAAQSDIP